MRTIYILNYQREIPPFAQMEVLYARQYFDEVIYVTRKLVNDNSKSINFSNVRVVQISKLRKLISLFKLLVLCLSKTVLSQIYKAVKQGVFSLCYLKSLFLELYVSEQLYTTCKNYGKAINDSDKFVLSCWFNGVAIAAAKLQDEMQYKSYSFAHAFEVDPSRNPYVGYLMEDYKHKHLTRISFIAETMLKRYEDKVYPIIGVNKNAFVDYLGTLKKYSSHMHESRVFTICSCSTVNKIKRLQLLVEALANINEFSIRWIHIGDGPDLNAIKLLSKSIISSNVECSFLGRLTNDEVHEFYSSNSIDLFINVSLSEGLPISIMEAMSYSIPCMATDVGGTSEIVNRENGILINSDITSIDLSTEIVRFMQMDYDYKEKMRLYAFNDWNNKFNADKNVSAYFTKIISLAYDRQ